MAGSGASRRPGRGSSAAEASERGARVARSARPAVQGWLRSRRTAWWARTPRPGASRVEGRERMARRVRPLSLSLSAWWARAPRPSVSRVEGRERRARRVRPPSLSLLVFVGARESSRGVPSRAPAALLRVRLRSSRTTACGRRRGVCAPLSLRLSPVPRLSHRVISTLHTETGVNPDLHTVTSNKS